MVCTTPSWVHSNPEFGGIFSATDRMRLCRTRGRHLLAGAPQSVEPGPLHKAIPRRSISSQRRIRPRRPPGRPAWSHLAARPARSAFPPVRRLRLIPSVGGLREHRQRYSSDRRRRGSEPEANAAVYVSRRFVPYPAALLVRVKSQSSATAGAGRSKSQWPRFLLTLPSCAAAPCQRLQTPCRGSLRLGAASAAGQG